MREYKLYKEVISESINKIEQSLIGITKEMFMKNILLQDATLMRLQVIGENIKALPDTLKKPRKEIKWRKFEKLRDIISHKYDSVDYEIIWNFIDANLKELKEIIKNI